MGEIAKINNIEIWWEDFGDKSNQTILLIMGANANCMQWPDELIGNLVSRNYHVVRFDNRDVGKSTRFGKESIYSKFARLFVPEFLLSFFVNKLFDSIIDDDGNLKESDIKDTDYDLDDMAKDAVSLLDHLNIDKAHIVGASMGGMITQLIGLNYPERALSLVPIMSSPGMGDEELSDMTSSLIKGIQESFLLDAKGRHEDAVVRIYKELTGSRFPFNEAKFREDLIPVMAHGNNPFCKHGEAAGSSPSRKSRLSEINIPTLVIHGTEDAILGLDHGLALADNIPNAKKYIMDGVGHEIPEELLPEITEKMIETFKEASQ
jgi:pimeloyl-ACP methyl ester carboxylesterase|tara:strand:+ start:2829 stop:3788 length:960 start_codon:yes stop_codon:yes gene_type:complete